ncbi:hypothetical protein DSECCO2_397870 [anaerobic digester metagenome]|jgi:hypothetical protein
MNRTSVQLADGVSPWREIRLFAFFTVGLFFQNQPVAGIAAILPVARFLFNKPFLHQIIQGALDGAAGELQVGGYGLDRRPAIRTFSRTVTEVNINRPRPMGELIGRGRINVVKVAHGSSAPLRSDMAAPL